MRQDELLDDLNFTVLQEYNEEMGCVMSPKSSTGLPRMSSFPGSESQKEIYKYDTLDEVEIQDRTSERDRLQSCAIELKDSNGESYREYKTRLSCDGSPRPRLSFTRVFSFSGIVLPDVPLSQKKKNQKRRESSIKEEETERDNENICEFLYIYYFTS